MPFFLAKHLELWYNNFIMFIDIHAHLNDERLIHELEEVLARAKSSNVGKVICVGCDVSTSKKAVEIAERFENVFACVGIHPEYAKNAKEGDIEEIRSLANSKKVVAIGEIGLDYHYEGFDKVSQIALFERQLRLASELNLPIQIHSRDATGDTMEVLNRNRGLLMRGGVFHCYSGSVETMREVVKLGLKISIGGVLTFKNARSLLDVAAEVPLESVLFETDCPYLAPVPHRGERNEPKNVEFVAKKFAEIRGLSLEEVEKIVEKNTNSVFGI